MPAIAPTATTCPRRTLREGAEPEAERDEHGERDPEGLADDPGGEDAEPETAARLRDRVTGQPDTGGASAAASGTPARQRQRAPRLGPRRDRLARDMRARSITAASASRIRLVQREIGDPVRLGAHVSRTLEGDGRREERDDHPGAVGAHHRHPAPPTTRARAPRRRRRPERRSAQDRERDGDPERDRQAKPSTSLESTKATTTMLPRSSTIASVSSSAFNPAGAFRRA